MSDAKRTHTDPPAAAVAWAQKLRGKLLVFDGPDGSGKSTQVARFSQLVQRSGVRVCHVREPGGTNIGEKIRNILLDPANEEMDLRCEMLLYMASRAQLVKEILRPAISEGQMVLADRFISSTLAYQGYAGGLPVEEIRAVARVALEDIWPDLVVIFDVDEETATQRLAGRGRTKYVEVTDPSLFSDRIEMRSREYHRAVREGYRRQAELDPDRYLIIDARDDEDQVNAALLASVEGWLAQQAADPAQGG